MPVQPRPRVEPTDDWHQIELLARAPHWQWTRVTLRAIATVKGYR